MKGKHYAVKQVFKKEWLEGSKKKHELFTVNAVGHILVQTMLDNDKNLMKEADVFASAGKPFFKELENSYITIERFNTAEAAENRANTMQAEAILENRWYTVVSFDKQGNFTVNGSGVHSETDMKALPKGKDAIEQLDSKFGLTEGSIAQHDQNGSYAEITRCASEQAAKYFLETYTSPSQNNLNQARQNAGMGTAKKGSWKNLPLWGKIAIIVGVLMLLAGIGSSFSDDKPEKPVIQEPTQETEEKAIEPEPEKAEPVPIPSEEEFLQYVKDNFRALEDDGTLYLDTILVEPVVFEVTEWEFGDKGPKISLTAKITEKELAYQAEDITVAAVQITINWLMENNYNPREDYITPFCDIKMPAGKSPTGQNLVNLIGFAHYSPLADEIKFEYMK